MSLSDVYDRRLYLCLPRQPRSFEWIEQILHRLWDHGLDFMDFKLNGRVPLTWEEQLDATNIGQFEMEAGETFRSYIGRVARVERLGLIGGSFWTAHVAGLPYLSFDLQKHPSLDWIVLSQRGLELEPYWDRKEEQYETPLGYLAVYQAFLEWAKVLCEIIGPLFGFGYCERYLTDHDQYYEYVKMQGEVPQPGQLPPIDDWFSHPPLRYIAPALLTPDLQLDLLSHEHWQLERLATGGIFVTTPDPEYTYMAYGGYSALDHSNQKGEATEAAVDLAHRERAETLRALTIFTAIDDSNGVHKTRAELESLDAYRDEDGHD